MLLDAYACRQRMVILKMSILFWNLRLLKEGQVDKKSLIKTIARISFMIMQTKLSKTQEFIKIQTTSFIAITNPIINVTLTNQMIVPVAPLRTEHAPANLPTCLYASQVILQNLWHSSGRSRF